jgi:hypothetical protein
MAHKVGRMSTIQPIGLGATGKLLGRGHLVYGVFPRILCEPMIGPDPMPTSHSHAGYATSPDLGQLADDQRRTLDAFMDYLGTRVPDPVVVRAVRTDEHHVFELETGAGPMLVLERHTG